MAFKINESIIVIQAEATSPNRTNVVFGRMIEEQLSFE